MRPLKSLHISDREIILIALIFNVIFNGQWALSISRRLELRANSYPDRITVINLNGKKKSGILIESTHATDFISLNLT